MKVAYNSISQTKHAEQLDCINCVSSLAKTPGDDMNHMTPNRHHRRRIYETKISVRRAKFQLAINGCQQSLSLQSVALTTELSMKQISLNLRWYWKPATRQWRHGTAAIRSISHRHRVSQSTLVFNQCQLARAQCNTKRSRQQSAPTVYTTR